MAKSSRCKTKKRLNTAKRQRLNAMLEAPAAEKHHANLRRVMDGTTVVLSRPKNAFKHPGAKDAVFPQHKIMKPIDFRSEALPMAAYVWRGNQRKFTGDMAEYMSNLAKQHPKMEVLAGGGAVLATTGQKVSEEEAELIATQVQNPAALENAAVPHSATAVAAAVAEGMQAAPVIAASAAPSAPLAAGAPTPAAAPEPENAVDTSRRPVVKDQRRQKRVEEPRERAGKKSSKKGPENPAAPPVATSVKKKDKAKKKGSTGVDVDMADA